MSFIITLSGRRIKRLGLIIAPSERSNSGHEEFLPETCPVITLVPNPAAGVNCAGNRGIDPTGDNQPFPTTVLFGDDGDDRFIETAGVFHGTEFVQFR